MIKTSVWNLIDASTCVDSTTGKLCCWFKLKDWFFIKKNDDVWVSDAHPFEMHLKQTMF